MFSISFVVLIVVSAAAAKWSKDCREKSALTLWNRQVVLHKSRHSDSPELRFSCLLAFFLSLFLGFVVVCGNFQRVLWDSTWHLHRIHWYQFYLLHLRSLMELFTLVLRFQEILFWESEHVLCLQELKRTSCWRVRNFVWLVKDFAAQRRTYFRPKSSTTSASHQTNQKHWLKNSSRAL